MGCCWVIAKSFVYLMLYPTLAYDPDAVLKRYS